MSINSVESAKRFYFEMIKNKKAEGTIMHSHDDVEIYYLTNGVLNCFIDNTMHTIMTGDIIIVPPKVLHSSNYQSNMRSRYLIQCDMSYIPDSLRGVYLSSTQIIYRNNPISETNKIFESILRDYEDRDEFFIDSIKSTLGAFLISLERSNVSNTSPNVKRSFVDEAVSYIHDNYANSITLSDAARHCMVCHEYLSREFKKCTGIGFNEYLTIFRINKAQNMIIQQPNMSMSEIAYCCGFNDSNYFSTRFKAVVGVSPTKFLKQKKFKNI